MEFSPLSSRLSSEEAQYMIARGTTQYIRYPHGCRLNKKQFSKPWMVSIEDVRPARTSGQLTFISTMDAMLHYGVQGIAPSAQTSPDALLTQQLPLPKNTLGILHLRQHIPFKITVPARSQSLLTVGNTIVPVLPHEKNVEKSSLTKVLALSRDIAKTFDLAIQSKIYHDPKREHFFEELTLPLDGPNLHNNSSGTLMIFEGKDHNRSTAYHYHPGERRLHIITTEKPAGVMLNFCGIHEAPAQRADTHLHIPFPKNALSTLKFPAFTHHRFYGEFVCQSVHPREGSHFIESMKNGACFDKGSLEAARVFSNIPGAVLSIADKKPWGERMEQKNTLLSL